MGRIVVGKLSLRGIAQHVLFSDDHASATLRPEILREVFYADCTEEDYQRACSLLVPQATAPFITPLQLSDANFGRIPRVYIECVHDRAITLPAQRSMHQAMGCDRVFTLDSSHSPFLAKPGELVDCLLQSASLRMSKHDTAAG